MRDLIFVSLEPWDEVWRRNQFVCAELARRFPDRRILFVERPLFLPVLGRALLRSRQGAALRAVRSALVNRFRRLPDFPGIRVYTPLKWFPNPLPGARAWNEGRMTRGIQSAAKRAGVRDPLLWLNPHDAGFLIARLGERGVVYDITDDWELAEPDGPARARIADQDRELCRRADLTVVCSQALFDSRQGIARRLLMLPNGVNAGHYARTGKTDPRPHGLFAPDGTFVPSSTTNPFIRTATTPTNPLTATEISPSTQTSTTLTEDENQTPTTATKAGAASPTRTPTNLTRTPTPGTGKGDWPRPVFGYTGSLHRERIDLDLVELLAQRFPRGSVVLVGPQHWSDDSLARALRKHPNLHAPGSVPYSAIPEVMARFDVCIVPHLQSQFVESLNPIKLWEFLACGKPIVSTDVAGFRDFPALVRLAKDAPAFLQQCQNALQEVNACAEVSTPTNNDGLAATNNDRRTPTNFDQQTATNGDKSIPRDEAGTPSNHDNPVQPNTDKGRCLSNERQREARNHSWSGRVDELIRAWREADLIPDEDASSRSDAPDVIKGAHKEAR